MAEQLNYTCSAHPNSRDCPDVLVVYDPRFDEFGLPIRDGGDSVMIIQFCPWCGTRLPDSKRDLWFERLAEMGFDDPAIQSIPNEFQTDAWWKNRP
jgi:hypothetical protein